MNGLYSTLEQKKKYYNNSDAHINGFWCSLLGILGIRIIKPKNVKMNQVLNRSYMTLIYSQDFYTNDDLPDHIISIKVLRELNIINLVQSKSLFTFLDKNKTTINQNELRAVLKSLPLYKIRPNSFISDVVYDFMNGKRDLEFITHRLFIYNQTQNLSDMFNEFGNLYRNDLLQFSKD
jgi:hypothetical protein